jgi:hypothetical protein
MADLFGATDADNDPLSYVFYDATPGGGHFVVNGVTQAANQIFAVTAAQLAQTTFVPGPGQSDDLLVGAIDGFAVQRVVEPAHRVSRAECGSPIASLSAAS